MVKVVVTAAFVTACLLVNVSKADDRANALAVANNEPLKVQKSSSVRIRNFNIDPDDNNISFVLDSSLQTQALSLVIYRLVVVDGSEKWEKDKLSYSTGFRIMPNEKVQLTWTGRDPIKTAKRYYLALLDQKGRCLAGRSFQVNPDLL